MKKRLLVVLVFAVAALLSVYSQQNKKELTKEEIRKLNSAPQEEYPEFTLEEQRAAMKLLKEERRKKRIENLRDKIPPADWISFAYHGLVLDANLDVIELTPKTVAKIQESIFLILQQSTLQQSIVENSEAAKSARTTQLADLKKAFKLKGLKEPQKRSVRDVVLNTLLLESNQTLQERYGWRLRLLNKGTNINPAESSRLFPAFDSILKRRALQENLFDEPPHAQYIEACRAEKVPIPPNWPDPKWISQGKLDFVFIGDDKDAEVFAFKDPSVKGVCYALPRRKKDTTRSIELLGIICQSDETGKACFWDNKTPDNEEITGPDIQLDISQIGNGFTLGENCTVCHRGDNVFNIHPGTALQLQRPNAPGGPYDTSPSKRYTPIGQSEWNNNGPLILASPPVEQDSCVACHAFPELTPDYCTFVLQPAAKTTMPPHVGRVPRSPRAGWPGTSFPVLPEYADHIGQLATLCSQ